MWSQTNQPHYGRRRFIAAVVALSCVALLCVGVVQLGVWARDRIKGQDDARAAAMAGTTFPVPTACNPKALDMSVDAPVETRVGAGATITLVMRNVGSDACVLDVGASHLSFIVGSANTTLLNSSVCPTGQESHPLLINTGESATISLHWDGTIANTECAMQTPQLEAPAGAGSGASSTDGDDGSGESSDDQSGGQSGSDDAGTGADEDADSSNGQGEGAEATSSTQAAANVEVSGARSATGASWMGHAVGVGLTVAGGAKGAAGVHIGQGVSATVAATAEPSQASQENPPIAISAGGSGGYAQAGTYWIRIQLEGADIIDARPMLIS